MSRDWERGAVAVEFAILLPLLLMLVLGIAEFGRAYNIQITITNAAREGARSMAIYKNQDKARLAAKTAASHLNPVLADGNIAFSQNACPVNSQNTVTVTYTLNTMTGITGPLALTGRGSMLCGG